MKYAGAVIELMASFPGRDWSMARLVGYCCPEPRDLKERNAVRTGVKRVLLKLAEQKMVLITPAKNKGGSALYMWKANDSPMRQHGLCRNRLKKLKPS